MPAICVFCGSGTGNNPEYASNARVLGELIANSNTRLIYGGGNIGLMGIIASEVMRHGGEVTGVIPTFLYEKEVGHGGITSLEIVQSMHERKKRMADLSDFFVAIPGGWGTLEELAEILTWKQLGLIHQPVGLLNVNGFFDPLVDQFKNMVEEGFLRKSNLDMLIVADTPRKLLTSIGVLTV
jgi:uncharacterized protein (TIGR00730 family)